MNTTNIGKFSYTSMINTKYKIGNFSVTTDEGPSPKLALSGAGSTGNIES